MREGVCQIIGEGTKGAGEIARKERERERKTEKRGK